jgi:cation diffusion facilitator CzcD-associated flavoprotein CzcO
MPADDPSSPDADEVFRAWLDRFGSALERADPAALADCFIEDGHWRDILTFGWEFRTFSGRDEIREGSGRSLAEVQPREVRVAADRMAPRLVKRSAKRVVEAFFDFDTAVGRSSAFVRLLLDEADPAATKAWLLLTTLHEIRGFEEKIGPRRPTGVEYSQNFAGDNWLDKRVKAQEYADRDPEVLIVGAGQGGLALAARLGQMGVDALIVERNARVGDNWRNRYHSLTLHNEVWANSLPYIPFPPTWPAFLPKDKLAGWLEAYAEFMELKVWTDTEFVSGGYDEAAGLWTAHLERNGQSGRTVRVPHIVLATGSVSGVPRVPTLPGLDSFEGEVIHSSQFTSGIPYKGQRAIVVGTGNSGHDVAQDLHSNGAADVTIVQRSGTSVVSLVPSGTMVFALYSEGPVEDIDLITASIPYTVLKDTYQWLTRKTCSLDEDLLEGLQSAGFETDFEPDGTGFHMRYLRTGGGYYINVGCSELIAARKVRLVRADDMGSFTGDGLQLADGTHIGCDLLVLATGYENQQESIRRMFGDDVADKVGPIWGFDEQGYMRNMWKRTNQEGFWLMGGGLNECRLYSRFLAVQIKADLEGMLPRKVDQTAAVTTA